MLRAQDAGRRKGVRTLRSMLLLLLHVLLHSGHLAHHAGLPRLCGLRCRALSDGEARRGDSGEAGSKGN